MCTWEKQNKTRKSMQIYKKNQQIRYSLGQYMYLAPPNVM